ncbi:MAG: ATP-binding protein, partial [Deltaproteobacteria bacterium]
LKFVIQEEGLSKLKNPVELRSILQSLQRAFGGLADLGLIDDYGLQISYVGPFDLEKKTYGDQEWFMKCAEKGSYVSDVFLGYRQVPHIIIAVRSAVHNRSFHILRAALDMKRFVEILSSLELSEKSEAFLCNRKGGLQTPSKFYHELPESTMLFIAGSENLRHSQVLEAKDKEGHSIVVGYASIENSPFILLLVNRSKEIMKGWYSIREKMNWFFGASVIAIVIVVVGVSTMMVNKIYEADEARLRAMERLENSNRLASIGRLAAGVAHEINNPLAVINENAGLIKDLFSLKEEYREDRRLMGLVDDVLDSVERCGEVTKQLLGFARHFEPKIEPIRMEKVIEEVLSFHRKEAWYRNIEIRVDIPQDFPVICSDHGKLQQIFLNLVNNSFEAMSDGGHFDIVAENKGEGFVTIQVRDDGSGISEEDQQRIFEPFFTMKGSKGGTGLGLFITYGLVRELHGDISVQSKVGEGTIFTITLPTRMERETQDESAAC